MQIEQDPKTDIQGLVDKVIQYNKDYLTFLQLLLDNFKENNNTMYNNLNNNFSINKYKCIDTDNAESIVQYLILLICFA